MEFINRTASLALTTALVSATWAGSAWAQSTQLTEEQIASLEGECRELAQAIQSGELPEGADANRIATALEEGNVEECRVIVVELDESMQDTETAEGEATDSESLTDEAVATEQVRITEEALIEGLARVRVPEPEVDVDVPAPNVRVTTGQPQVSVQEGESTIEVSQDQPTISVEIPEIIVRVEIPAPKLYVRRGEPSVQVSAADPQVEVEQGDPTVSVTQGEPEIAIDLDLEEGEAATEQANADTSSGGEAGVGGQVRVAAAEPTVELVRPEGEAQIEYASSQATVEYEPAEPQVQVNVSSQPRVEIARVGEVEVVYEDDQQREARRQQMAEEREAEDRQASNDQQRQQQPAGELPEQVTIAELLGKDVVGEDGEDLGSPEAFVRQDGKMLMVLSHGGFLGLGDKEVSIPLNRVVFTPDALRVRGMTEADVEQAATFEYNEEARVEDDHVIRLRQ